MNHSKKSLVKKLLVLALLVVPATQTRANDLPQQVNELQTSITAYNDKVALLAANQQKAILDCENMI
jgi:hypothetical protein